ncbi:MAG: methionyl-tRNA formyltransferase [Bryobacterales bacterium]|nr:methionyl-tRNA formyltransferase [Bryobacterales bacterium]MBV9399297.1 methionyl-tRNA formyltransferase [Bryobacterales bacterium]
MKLIFMGTPAFAVPTLEKTAAAGHEIAAVFTQPDRPKGRGQRQSMPPVKEAALRLGVAVFQPERVRRPEIIEQLKSIAPDAMVVVGYGQIIPQPILGIPPQGIVNVHASLLPKYRGAAPIQWAVANGESRTGVTTMKIDAGLDTGDMLLKWETEIGLEETAIELGQRLAFAGGDLLVRTLSELKDIQPEPQDNSQASYAPILKKEDGHLDWSMPAGDILNRVRGFLPWPGCYGFVRGQRLHIWKGRAAQREVPPGRLQIEGRRLYAGCRGGAMEILEVQLEGKKRMEAAAFLNGFPLQDGEALA